MRVVGEVWRVSDVDIQALIDAQIAAVSLNRDSRRKIGPVLRSIVVLDSQCLDLDAHGRAVVQNQEGTRITPDQDVKAMDASIPSAPTQPNNSEEGHG